ncbi:MAG: asparaginase [Thermomicrobiales bacterium]|nr:asparaginase [Thermomicrobiales bacterium]
METEQLAGLPGAPLANGRVPLAVVRRGDEIESIHTGTVVVANQQGQVVASAGGPSTFAYFRSSAKPFQAVIAIESGAADAYGFTPAELALCCASHLGAPMHQEQVTAMLAKLGLTPDALRCGCPTPADVHEAALVEAGLREHSPLHCDCSGKHTGMLATCVHRGYPIDSYLLPDHPLQQEILTITSSLMGVDEQDVRLATDGCSVPTFGSTIAAFATAYAHLARPDTSPSPHAPALRRLRDGMMAHPANVSGYGNLVTSLMEIGYGRIVVKTGAEGLICLGIPSEGLGIAIRIADGTFRSQPVIVAGVLRQLGLFDEVFYAALDERHPSAIRNHNGWQVGEHLSTVEMEWQA